MSGAGKSTVLDALEDMGWDCVDNLPSALLDDFVHGERAARQKMPVAVGMDVRSRGFDPKALPDLLALDRGGDARNPLPRLRRQPSSSAATTRPGGAIRSRPTAPPRTASRASAARPRRCARIADIVLDTTDLTPADLRDALRQRYGGEVDQPVITIASFGFARGISRTADLVFDMRFLANPHWVDDAPPAHRRGSGGPGLCRQRPGLGGDDDPG